MKRNLLLWILAAMTVFGAADEWAKVKALKAGTDIRVYKKGSSQPVVAQMADLTDDNLVILVKKTETAIPRDQIDRIDARPGARTVTKETTTKEATTPGDSGGAAFDYHQYRRELRQQAGFRDGLPPPAGRSQEVRDSGIWDFVFGPRMDTNGHE